jgi:hypothetical protein
MRTSSKPARTSAVIGRRTPRGGAQPVAPEVPATRAMNAAAATNSRAWATTSDSVPTNAASGPATRLPTK